MKYLHLKGTFPSEMYEDMVKSLAYSAPLYATIKPWAIEFERDKESVEDDHRAAQPPTAATKEKLILFMN